jgi:hypothetical protein
MGAVYSVKEAFGSDHLWIDPRPSLDRALSDSQRARGHVENALAVHIRAERPLCVPVLRVNRVLEERPHRLEEAHWIEKAVVLPKHRHRRHHGHHPSNWDKQVGDSENRNGTYS